MPVRPRYFVRPFGRYWTIHDRFLSDATMGHPELTEGGAQQRANGLEKNIDTEFLPHCRDCEGHVATDANGFALVHSYPPPMTEEEARFTGQNCIGSRRPTFLPADDFPPEDIDR